MNGAPIVLVVDDDDAIREAIDDVLRDAGFAVVTVGDGEHALEWLRGNRGPCMVLLDLMMPGLDGWQVLDAALREHLVAPRDVVVLTAHRGPGLPDGVECLNKPIGVPAVLDAVRRHCPAAPAR
jgi:CheY-like chemotaxis protein